MNSSPSLLPSFKASWLSLISYCKNDLRYGEVTLRIVDGQPTNLVVKEVHRRFDKADFPVDPQIIEAFANGNQNEA